MKRFGRYRVVEEVGEGTFGIVYRARDEKLDREVALKVIRDGCFKDASIRKRFATEARLLSRLNHHNIEILYDFESRGDDDFLVMEFIAGQTLQRRIASGPLPQKEIVHLGTQLCDALDAAHDAGVVHRDLKPGNLMVRPDGTLKVLDFGLAKHLRTSNPASADDVSTQTGTIVGTFPYLTPEQLRGEAAEARSDIHCVGAILYEMSTGLRPFQGSGTPLLASILNEAPAPPRSLATRVSRDFEAIILKCLEKRLEDRYQTAAELGAALRALGTAEARRERRQKRKWQRRWRLYAPSMGVAIVAALVLAVVFRVPQHRGVAVLPFESLGPGGQEYYADAVADQLFSKLVRVSDLPVTPRSSAHAVDTNQPLRKVAQLLGVDAIVDGTVLRADGEIRVSISVARIKRPRWIFGQEHAETVYAGERTFAESELLRQLGSFVTEIADQLVIELDPEVRKRFEDEREVDPVAFDRYARGRHEWSRRTPQAFRNAIQMFMESIRADSTFAPAYAGLADCHALFGSFGYDIAPPRHAMPKAREFAEKALEHDKSLAEAHTALAHILHNYEWDWDGARDAFERAIALSPGDPTPYQWYGFYFATMGQLDEAIRCQKKALEQEPNSAVALASLARMHYYDRDFDRAVESVQRALELDQNFLPATILLGAIYTQLGRIEDARQTFEAGRVVTKGAPVFEAGLGAVHAASGDVEAARGVLRDLEKHPGYVPAYYSAAIYVKLGDHDHAFELLGEAVGERSEAVLYIGVDPWLDDLRSDPRLHELMRQIGLPTELHASR